MTSKQELRDEIAELNESRLAWREEAYAAASQRDRLKVDIAEVRTERDRAVRERDLARREVAALVSERNDALDRLAAAQGTIRDLTAPEPAQVRPFRVGDRVRVAEGATWRPLFGSPTSSRVSGREGTVDDIACDGDLYVIDGRGDVNGYASSQFCTLIPPTSEPTSEPNVEAPPAPTQGVTLHLPDGTRVEIPCEGGKVVDDGSLWVASATDGTVAWINPAAVVAAVVNR